MTFAITGKLVMVARRVAETDLLAVAPTAVEAVADTKWATPRTTDELTALVATMVSNFASPLVNDEVTLTDTVLEVEIAFRTEAPTLVEAMTVSDLLPDLAMMPATAVVADLVAATAFCMLLTAMP